MDFRTRPDAEMRLVESQAAWEEWMPGSGDMDDQFNFPPWRPQESADNAFIELKDASRYVKKRPSSSSKSFSSSSHSGSLSFVTSGRSSSSSGSSVAGSRHILREIDIMLSNEHPNMDVYVSQTNFGIWKVVMQGPPDSAYEKGVFLLLVDIGPEFPRGPPASGSSLLCCIPTSPRSVIFLLSSSTSFFLSGICSVRELTFRQHGRVCHPIFDRDWLPDMHVYTVLQQVYGILMTLEVSSRICHIPRRCLISCNPDH